MNNGHQPIKDISGRIPPNPPNQGTAGVSPKKDDELTLRDKFAIACLPVYATRSWAESNLSNIASLAYSLADAMLEFRKR
jgi:hypothetical protein